ncbi:metal ABC transporter substrate-binding protein [Geodermatophilus sp. SYSU D00742]
MTSGRPRAPLPVRLLAALLGGLLLGALPGCTGEAARGAAGTVDVVTTSYPLRWVTEQVGGARVEVTDLARGAAVHGFEPTARQVVRLGQADLVVHQSGGLQPGVDEVLAQQAPAALVEAATVADLDGDPHFWLDPLRLAEIGRDVGDALVALDPASADDVGARVTRLEETLRALDREYADALAPCRGAVLVTSHEAFGYLADRYGLRQVGIAGLDPGVEPSPARVRRVAETVRDAGVRTVFLEATTAPAGGRALAGDLGAAVDVLHPVERVADGEDYPGLMRQNLAALQRGLVCGPG